MLSLIKSTKMVASIAAALACIEVNHGEQVLCNGLRMRKAQVDFLGLDRKQMKSLSIEERKAMIEEQFRKVEREFHPERHINKTPLEQKEKAEIFKNLKKGKESLLAELEGHRCQMYWQDKFKWMAALFAGLIVTSCAAEQGASPLYLTINDVCNASWGIGNRACSTLSGVISQGQGLVVLAKIVGQADQYLVSPGDDTSSSNYAQSNTDLDDEQQSIGQMLLQEVRSLIY